MYATGHGAQAAMRPDGFYFQGRQELRGKSAACTAGSAAQHVVLHCIAQSSTAHRLCMPGRACSSADKATHGRPHAGRTHCKVALHIQGQDVELPDLFRPGDVGWQVRVQWGLKAGPLKHADALPNLQGARS